MTQPGESQVAMDGFAAGLGDARDWPLGCLPADWAASLRGRVDLPALARLRAFLVGEQQAGKIIYPPAADIFAALRQTPLARVRVVILGQDPYHGEGQAHGFAFSVRPGVKIPSSLRNIFTEFESDIGGRRKADGNLVSWAEAGVLLLNTVLTVAAGLPNSHARRGWEGFTDAVVSVVKEQVPHAVFMLWGKPAEAKAGLVDTARHLVLRSSHPSGLSARRTAAPFIGARPFSKANAFLEAHGIAPVFTV